MSSDTVVAKGSFFVAVDGAERLVSEGETFAADHPVVRASAEDSFIPFKVDNQIEAATAKPGSKRNARVKRTKAGDKPEPSEPSKAETPSEPAAGESTEGSSDFAKVPADVKD